jgi:hypothetical protein
MSIPPPDIEIAMLEEMLQRKYKFHNGDVCRFLDYDFIGNKSYGREVVIKYPYYYKENSIQMYVVDSTPIPYTDDELELVTKNENGEQETYDFLQRRIDEVNSEEYRKNYKSV